MSRWYKVILRQHEAKESAADFVKVVSGNTRRSAARSAIRRLRETGYTGPFTVVATYYEGTEEPADGR